MPAANTDKFRKAAPNFSTILAEGGCTNSDAEIACSDLSSLPTDTAVDLSIDKTDANDQFTPAKKEVITGVVSGNNIITALRGQEGTAQEHAGGAKVENELTAKAWNDLIDGLLVSLNQDGSLKTDIVIPTKVSGFDKVSVTRSAKTIAHNTDTKIDFDSEIFDSNALHGTEADNTKLVCKKAGTYAITANGTFLSNGTGARQMVVLKNGDVSLTRQTVPPTATTAVDLSCATIRQLAVDDYIELQVFQTSGGNLNFVASEFSMALLPD